MYVDIDGRHHIFRDLPKDPLCLFPSKEVSSKVLGELRLTTIAPMVMGRCVSPRCTIWISQRIVYSDLGIPMDGSSLFADGGHSAG